MSTKPNKSSLPAPDPKMEEFRRELVALASRYDAAIFCVATCGEAGIDHTILGTPWSVIQPGSENGQLTFNPMPKKQQVAQTLSMLDLFSHVGAEMGEKFSGLRDFLIKAYSFQGMISRHKLEMPDEKG